MCLCGCFCILGVHNQYMIEDLQCITGALGQSRIAALYSCVCIFVHAPSTWGDGLFFFKASFFSVYSVTGAYSYIVLGVKMMVTGIYFRVLLLQPFAMPVFALFIILSGGFLSDCCDPLDETRTLCLSDAACEAQLLRSSCWSLSYWMKYAAQHILLSLLSLFKHAMLKSSFLLL